MKKAIIFVLIALFILSIWHISLGKSESTPQITNQMGIPTGLTTFWNTNKEQFDREFNRELKECDPTLKYAPQRYDIVVFNPKVSQVAWNVSSDGGSELEKTYLIYQYIAENFDYKVYENWRNTTEILESKNGDCADQSILLVSMLKNIGIDAYVIQGDIDKSDHAWVAARVDGSWIQIDPTAKNFWAVEECLQNESCPNKEVYTAIQGIFNDGASLRCTRS